MTPTDAARIAEACEKRPAGHHDGCVCVTCEDRAEAARFFRTLASSPADSAEDAAAVARELEAWAKREEEHAISPGRTGEGALYDMQDARLLRRAASLLRQSSAAVAEVNGLTVLYQEQWERAERMSARVAELEKGLGEACVALESKWLSADEKQQLARLRSLLHPPPPAKPVCGTCGGDGEIPYATHAGGFAPDFIPCPACTGDKP